MVFGKGDYGVDCYCKLNCWRVEKKIALKKRC